MFGGSNHSSFSSSPVRHSVEDRSLIQSPPLPPNAISRQRFHSVQPSHKMTDQKPRPLFDKEVFSDIIDAKVPSQEVSSPTASPQIGHRRALPTEQQSVGFPGSVASKPFARGPVSSKPWKPTWTSSATHEIDSRDPYREKIIEHSEVATNSGRPWGNNSRSPISSRGAKDSPQRSNRSPSHRPFTQATELDEESRYYDAASKTNKDSGQRLYDSSNTGSVLPGNMSRGAAFRADAGFAEVSPRQRNHQGSAPPRTKTSTLDFASILDDISEPEEDEFIPSFSQAARHDGPGAVPSFHPKRNRVQRPVYETGPSDDRTRPYDAIRHQYTGDSIPETPSRYGGSDRVRPYNHTNALEDHPPDRQSPISGRDGRKKTQHNWQHDRGRNSGDDYLRSSLRRIEDAHMPSWQAGRGEVPPFQPRHSLGQKVPREGHPTNRDDDYNRLYHNIRDSESDRYVQAADRFERVQSKLDGDDGIPHRHFDGRAGRFVQGRNHHPLDDRMQQQRILEDESNFDFVDRGRTCSEAFKHPSEGFSRADRHRLGRDRPTGSRDDEDMSHSSDGSTRGSMRKKYYVPSRGPVEPLTSESSEESRTGAPRARKFAPGRPRYGTPRDRERASAAFPRDTEVERVLGGSSAQFDALALSDSSASSKERVGRRKAKEDRFSRELDELCRISDGSHTRSSRSSSCSSSEGRGRGRGRRKRRRGGDKKVSTKPHRRSKRSHDRSPPKRKYPQPDGQAKVFVANLPSPEVSAEAVPSVLAGVQWDILVCWQIQAILKRGVDMNGVKYRLVGFRIRWWSCDEADPVDEYVHDPSAISHRTCRSLRPGRHRFQVAAVLALGGGRSVAAEVARGLGDADPDSIPSRQLVWSDDAYASVRTLPRPKVKILEVTSDSLRFSVRVSSVTPSCRRFIECPRAIFITCKSARGVHSCSFKLAELSPDGGLSDSSVGDLSLEALEEKAKRRKLRRESKGGDSDSVASTDSFLSVEKGHAYHEAAQDEMLIAQVVSGGVRTVAQAGRAAASGNKREGSRSVTWMHQTAANPAADKKHQDALSLNSFSSLSIAASTEPTPTANVSGGQLQPGLWSDSSSSSSEPSHAEHAKKTPCDVDAENVDDRFFYLEWEAVLPYMIPTCRYECRARFVGWDGRFGPWDRSLSTVRLRALPPPPPAILASRVIREKYSLWVAWRPVPRELADLVDVQPSMYRVLYRRLGDRAWVHSGNACRDVLGMFASRRRATIALNRCDAEPTGAQQSSSGQRDHDATSEQGSARALGGAKPSKKPRVTVFGQKSQQADATAVPRVTYSEPHGKEVVDQPSPAGDEERSLSDVEVWDTRVAMAAADESLLWGRVGGERDKQLLPDAVYEVRVEIFRYRELFSSKPVRKSAKELMRRKSRCEQQQQKRRRHLQKQQPPVVKPAKPSRALPEPLSSSSSSSLDAAGEEGEDGLSSSESTSPWDSGTTSTKGESETDDDVLSRDVFATLSSKPLSIPTLPLNSFVPPPASKKLRRAGAKASGPPAYRPTGRSVAYTPPDELVKAGLYSWAKEASSQPRWVRSRLYDPSARADIQHERDLTNTTRTTPYGTPEPQWIQP
eukprot:Rmarinus@m.11990